MLLGEIVVLQKAQSSSRAQQFLSMYRRRLEGKQQSNNSGCCNDVDIGDADDDAKRGGDVFYLQPRILKSVNTTNLRLQFEALLQRRAHVLRLNTNNPIQPGCGPPSQSLESAR